MKKEQKDGEDGRKKGSRKKRSSKIDNDHVNEDGSGGGTGGGTGGGGRSGGVGYDDGDTQAAPNRSSCSDAPGTGVKAGPHWTKCPHA